MIKMKKNIKIIKIIKIITMMMMTTKRQQCAVNTCGCRMCRKPPRSQLLHICYADHTHEDDIDDDNDNDDNDDDEEELLHICSSHDGNDNFMLLVATCSTSAQSYKATYLLP